MKAEDKTLLQIETVQCSDTKFRVTLKDGRRIAVPLWWLPRLQAATPEQRAAGWIMPFGDAIEWATIDEHVSIKGLLARQTGPRREATRAGTLSAGGRKGSLTPFPKRR